MLRALAACRYVTQMKKTVDDVANKQKAAANVHKVCGPHAQLPGGREQCLAQPFNDTCAWCGQDKKAAEAERQKELAELFAVAIKQPKVPIGAQWATHLPSSSIS